MYGLFVIIIITAHFIAASRHPHKIIRPVAEQAQVWAAFGGSGAFYSGASIFMVGYAVAVGIGASLVSGKPGGGGAFVAFVGHPVAIRVRAATEGFEAIIIGAEVGGIGCAVAISIGWRAALVGE